MCIEDWIDFTDKHIITKQEAIVITGQSQIAFNQALATGNIKPVFERGEGTGKVRLYLRSEIESYAARAKIRRNRLKK